MAAKAGEAFLALFDWRWPMRCHLISKSAVSPIFCRASWTLFSPKSRCPAAWAARTCSALNIFETARRRMSAGGRPAAAAAAAIRSRIAARLPAMSCTYLIEATIDFAVSAYLPVGSSLRYASNFGFAAGWSPVLESPMPSQYCASAIFGSSLTACSNWAFASGNLLAFHRMTPWLNAADALPPPAAPAAPARPPPRRPRRAGRAAAGCAQFHRLLAGLGGLVELFLAVVQVGKPVISVGEIGLQLDGLLICGLGFVVFLRACLHRADVGVALGAGRDHRDDFVELGDRLFILAGVAQLDTLVEALRRRLSLGLVLRRL